MITSAEITVHTQPSYKMFVGEEVLLNVGFEISKLTKPCKVLIVSDTNVAPLYATMLAISLEEAGFTTCEFALCAGEEHKTLETVGAILDFMANQGMSRDDLLVALGGGMVSDVATLAAALYHRGIAHALVPTSLLAAVDACIGGKSAVNLASGKNLAGIIKQPLAVFCDTLCFETLSDAQFAEGIAEAIKTAVIGDPKLFTLFVDGGAKSRLVQIIESCAKVKARIVEGDEHDEATRALLNLGHTLGHAIERCSNYNISHGVAVAMGLAGIARAAVVRGVAEADFDTMVVAVLEEYGLETRIPFAAEELLHAALSDKKRHGDTITVVMPHRIGECTLEELSLDELGELIVQCLEGTDA